MQAGKGVHHFILRVLQTHIMPLAPQLKHPAFIDEREERLISPAEFPVYRHL